MNDDVITLLASEGTPILDSGLNWTDTGFCAHCDHQFVHVSSWMGPVVVVAAVLVVCL